MEAKLKSSYKFPRAVLFSGHEFVKLEWRPVPAGFEDQARKDDRIEFRESKAEKKAAVKAAEVAPVPAPVTPPDELVVNITTDFTEEDKRVWETPEEKPTSGRRRYTKKAKDAEAED